MINKLSLYLVQNNPLWKDISTNLDAYTKLLSSVEEQSVIVFPEMFSSGFIAKPKEIEKDIELTKRWMRSFSADTNVTVMGSMPYFSNEKYVNRLYVFENGLEIGVYDKRHLFSLSNEHEDFNAGKERIVTNVSGWRMLLSICYDLRFPVWLRNNEDYDVLVNVVNWPRSRAAIWRKLLMARAIENQCYVIGVNRVGEDGNGYKYIGESCVVNPDGTILAEAGQQEELLKVELDYEKLIAFKEKFPFYRDRDQFEIIW